MIVRAHWTVNVVDALVDGNELNICPDGCHGLVDTGTTLLTFPTDAYRTVMDNIGSENLDCNNIQDMPDLSIRIDEEDYTLTPEMYII